MGYQTAEGLSSDKFKALAVQFENIAGGEIAIKDLVTVGTPAGSAEFDFSADQIWRWNTEESDWDKYYVYKPRGVQSFTWCNAGETTATTNTIPAGEGFFFRRGGSAVETITFSAPET